MTTALALVPKINRSRIQAEYLDWIDRTGNPHTRRGYESRFKALAVATEYAGTLDYLDALAAHPRQIALYTRERLLADYEESTAQKSFALLCQFCERLERAGILSESLAAIQPIKIARSHTNRPNRLKLADLARIDRYIETRGRGPRIWMRALRRLLFPHALRVGELVSLRRGDLRHQPDGTPVIWFLEKGHWSKSDYPILPDTESAIQALLLWLEAVGCRHPDAPLFPNPRAAARPQGAWFQWEAASIKCIENTVRKWGKACGLPWLTPHSFRHSGGTLCQELNLSTSEAAALLRHSEAYVTEKYYQDTKGTAILKTAERLRDALEKEGE